MHDVTLTIKREDLNDPVIQGNKWLKLRPNLQAARSQGYQRLITFGGYFSNHLYATAAAGNYFGFETVGIIRGHKPEKLSPTLQYASEQGMHLHFIERELYRQKHINDIRKQICKPFEPAYVIPEGGSNALAVCSVTEYATQFQDYDYICTAVGTGGTISGLIAGAPSRTHVLGFATLKGGAFLTNDINQLLTEASLSAQTSWELLLDYHFGGYAKTTDELMRFIVEFYHTHGIRLDPVYTGKMMFGIFDLIKKGYFEKGSRILAIHTGGLQGLDGFETLKQQLSG